MPDPVGVPQQSTPWGGLALNPIGSYSRRGAFPAPAESPRVGPCAAGLQARGRAWGCGLRETPLAPRPEQGFAVCALGVRRPFGVGSKLMQNTVKALSCELLRRGRGGCKEHAQPWVCLRGGRKGCCGKWPRHCSYGVLYLVYRIVPSGERKHARDGASRELQIPLLTSFKNLKRRELFKFVLLSLLSNCLNLPPHPLRLFASHSSREFLEHISNIAGSINVWNPCLYLWVDVLPQKLWVVW